MNSYKQIDALLDALVTYGQFKTMVSGLKGQHWSDAVKKDAGLKHLWPQLNEVCTYIEVNLFNGDINHPDIKSMDTNWGKHALQVVLGLIDDTGDGVPGPVWPKRMVKDGHAEFWVSNWGELIHYDQFEAWGDPTYFNIVN
jgi:hypothetical protein